MARIVCHNDESVREGYIRNGGKEVKMFTDVLKAFQCNNRIVMAQKKHLDDFYMIELLDDWNGGVPSWKYLRNLESPRVSSPGFGKDSKVMVIAPGTRYLQDNTIERHHYGSAGWLARVWGGIILGSRTGAMGAEFLFMDDNARSHRANIVDECL
ncbi:transposable element Tc3 transposase [Trichonephila clavipes]|nr:transposable element Tc3 transposase [Trichonephila clavipes]